MRKILILGAGKSSISLIDYLAEKAKIQQWQVTVADISEANALAKTARRPYTKALGFDFFNEKERQNLINESQIVVSMLPAAMHTTVAQDCIKFEKHLVTPSYISDAMRAMHAQVRKKGLVFMNEIGLDPGIDHMSSLKIINQLKGEGKVITGYKSHCGGLVAPESDNNLWHYKFTWNPRNVILAGQGEGFIQYLQNGKKVKLSYPKLFANTTELKVRGFGKFDSYPNRDSLKYIEDYGLKGVKTMYRGTLRRPPFCEGWQVLVDLGFTNRDAVDTKKFQQAVFRKTSSNRSKWPKRIQNMIQSTAVLPLLFLQEGKTVVPAELLQAALEQNWVMRPDDKDMVVMIHEFFYKEGKRNRKLQSSLVVVGEDSEHTAMAATVGLPLGMVTRMILNGEVKQAGVLMPSFPEVYNPILAELEQYGICFKEKIS